MIIKKKFLNWLVFLLPTDLERNSQLSKIVWRKGKTFNQIDLKMKNS